MNDKIKAIRDAEAEKRSKRQCSTGNDDLNKAVSWYLKTGFEDGFTAAHDLLMAHVGPLVEALKKAEYIIVEDNCEECGTFSGVKYHVTPVTEALETFRKEVGE